MGREYKIKGPKPSHEPLAQTIDRTKTVNKVVKEKARTLNKLQKEKKQEDYIDSKISTKILDIARDQQKELEEGDSDGRDSYDDLIGDEDEENADSYDEEEEVVEEYEIDEDYDAGLNFDGLTEEDKLVMSKFLPEAPMQRINLADLILDKINKKVNRDLQLADPNYVKPTPKGLNPKIVEAYTKVGLLLSRYKSGKIPKAFKIVPRLGNWEEILHLTKPENWTPHAYYEATRLFVSNLKANQTQRFLKYVLLDKVRNDIYETHKLSPHLYMALKKALYKPAAFFKGILFPLVESGCTLREAVIVGSVLVRVSVPMLHSAAALLKLSEMEYSGSTSLFIRILLDKKYALPYKAIDALVFHFISFQNKHDGEPMPVLWHQSLLCFVQRYKQDLTPEQKSALLDVVRVHFHHTITPEVRREINSSTCRGEMIEEPMDIE